MRAEVGMDSTPLQPAEREARRVNAGRNELVSRSARAIRKAGEIEPQKVLPPHIVNAMEHHHEDCDQPLRTESLAGKLRMNASGFHHHFKTIMAMSPVPLQQRFRLREAHHLPVIPGPIQGTNHAFDHDPIEVVRQTRRA